MSTKQHDESHAPLGRAIEIITLIAMAFMVIAIGAITLGVNGLRINGGPDGKNAAMSVEAEMLAPIDLNADLPITIDDNDRASVFGQAPVRATSPMATVEFLDPTNSQRVIWIIWQVAGPLLGLLVAWPVLKMARSARSGDPFTPANERRMWFIAGMVTSGGLAYSMIAGAAQTLLVQRSAAADLFAIVFEVSFIPIGAGLVLSALASIWHIGVALRDDADATI